MDRENMSSSLSATASVVDASDCSAKPVVFVDVFDFSKAAEIDGVSEILARCKVRVDGTNGAVTLIFHPHPSAPRVPDCAPSVDRGFRLRNGTFGEIDHDR